jgi:haloacetate dehalogenase
MAGLLPTFAHRRIRTGEVAVNAAVGGDGPPLVLLHGYPQTHVAWHKVAPRLAERFTVVCPDLRGYGDSDKPPGDPGHQRYAKRTMARDVRELMGALGHDRFAVVGHDRGALVGHRLALDHPDAVTHLVVLDVLPQLDMWEAMDRAFGLAGYHLFFLAQPADFPERLIGADPDMFLTHTLRSWCGTPGAITDQALVAYRAAFADPRTIHATCEDYRAGATVDVEADAADRDRGRLIRAPLLLLWGQPPGMELPFDPLAVWRRWAAQVDGAALACGHFLAEERPDEVVEALQGFLSASRREVTP